MINSKQSAATPPRAIAEDMFELRADALDTLLLASFITCAVLFLVDVALGQVTGLSYSILVPLGVVFGLLLVSFQFKRHQHIEIAGRILVIAQLAGPIIDALMRGPSQTTFFFFVFPVLSAGLITSTDAMIQVAGSVTAAMFVVSLLTHNMPQILDTSFVPALVCWLVAGITYATQGNILRMVHWALDVQGKDAERAEMFYNQGEELRETLLQLKHLNSQLETMYEELAVAQTKTEQISKAKSVFLSNMSHELRTPLNVIIGYSSSMLDLPDIYDNIALPTPYQNDIQLIKDNGYYLLGLINDILDLSKIEAGKLELHCTAVSLPDMFRGILATSLGLMKDKPIQLRPDYPENLPAVWADPTRVRQIILNLMSNAIKFTHTGSVTIRAAVEQGSVRISVIDTGTGIPERALPVIFDRFQQAESDTDKRYGGTGLGLDISKQLARMHGGDLSVQSVFGQGSTFSFSVPILTTVQAEHLVAPEGEASTVRILTPSEVGFASTILIVEDETSMRAMMRRTLESANFVVVDLQDGAQVIDTAVGLLPDLIVLDIRLPDIDGWQLLDNLKSTPETAAIPVIVCTVFEDEDHAKELGANIYIRKPFSADELLTCVQSLLPASVEVGKDN